MDMRKAAVAAGLTLTLSGCQTLINALERSVEANLEAVQLCYEHDLTVEAQELAYRETIGDFVAFPMGFHKSDFDTAKSERTSIIESLVEIERNIKQLLDLEKTEETGAFLERLKSVRTHSKSIRKQVKEIADAIPVGYVNIAQFLGVFVSAVNQIRTDAYALRTDILLLDDDLKAAVKSLKVSSTKVAALSKSIQEALRRIDHALTFIEALLTKSGSEAKKEIRKRVNMETITKALDTLLKYKVSEIAVSRLEEEFYIVESRLTSINDKAWLVISIAELLFANAIRGSLTPSDEDQADGGVLKKGSLVKSVTDKIKNTGPKKIKEAKVEITDADGKVVGKVDPIITFREALAIVACERVLRTAKNKEAIGARTDQLLNPVYQYLIKDYTDTLGTNETAQQAMQELISQQKANIVDHLAQALPPDLSGTAKTVKTEADPAKKAVAAGLVFKNLSSVNRAGILKSLKAKESAELQNQINVIKNRRKNRSSRITHALRAGFKP